MTRASGLGWYYVAATAARVGDEMVGVAVVLLILARTGSAPLAGAVMAAYMLPTVLSGPLLGAWLDGTRFRRAALAANQAMLAVVMVALYATVGTAPDWTAVALAPLVGVTVPMTSGGFTSLLPRFVPPEQLSRAHAFEGVSFNVSATLGPALAATVAAAVSPGAATLSIVGFAVISLAALGGIPAHVWSMVSTAQRSVGLATAIRTGLAHLIRTPPLRGVTLATSIGFTGIGMLTVAVPIHVERLAGDAALGGYVWTAIETGAIMAALAWGRWHARWRSEHVVLACLVGTGVGLFSWTMVGAFPALLVLAVMVGLASGANLPALITTRQRHTPTDLYGQISTTGASLKLGGFAVGAALAGQLVPLFGPVEVFAIAGAVQLLAAAVGAAATRPASITKAATSARI